ncbi:FK506-binding protein 15, partial [Austrofundulus limnaeus]|uniref:FK506-binding protein 15 n=1 Tax=Austrofundulus limnaeus TaxID=52670 RepID=A0A2I4D0T7_AUSLI
MNCMEINEQLQDLAGKADVGEKADSQIRRLANMAVFLNARLGMEIQLVNELQAQITETKQQKQLQSEEMAKLKQENELLRNELGKANDDALVQENKNLKRDLEMVTVKHKAAEAHAKSLKAVCDVTQQRLQRTEESLASEKAAHKEVKKKLENKSSELCHMTEKFDKLQNYHASCTHIHKEQVQVLKKRNSDLQRAARLQSAGSYITQGHEGHGSDETLHGGGATSTPTQRRESHITFQIEEEEESEEGSGSDTGGRSGSPPSGPGDPSPPPSDGGGDDSDSPRVLFVSYFIYLCLLWNPCESKGKMCF